LRSQALQTITKWYSSSSEPLLFVHLLHCLSFRGIYLCLPYSISRLCEDNLIAVLYCLSLTFETVGRYCEISKTTMSLMVVL